MIQLTLPELQKDLAVLEVAQETLASAEEAVARARLPYTHAISILSERMHEDGNVVAALELWGEHADLYEQAKKNVQDRALSVWMNEKTEGKKEWEQGGWEIRLRTTRTPIVEKLVDFVTHLVELGAVGSVIKRLTLNKADTVSLHESLDEGLNGLEVEEKTTCSVKRKKDA